MKTQGPIQVPKPLKCWESVALFLFGAWLVAGGVFSLSRGQWAPFLPPQLDIIALAGWLTSEKWTAYIGGALVTGLGAVLCLVAVLAAGRQRAA